MSGGRAVWLVGISVIPILLAGAASGAPDEAPVASGSTQVGEIVVTATRREESLDKVPESISAFTGKTLDTLEIKSFADLARYTPGVSFNQDSHDIFIRGIDSTAGSSTTGIYIDDTPIQLRNLGLNANNSLPAVFDLSRVEILRGPQGTLFGAGSEGGTVRYITNQPSLTSYSGMAHAELAFTQDGAPSYEGGAAVGGPIVQDQLGFRLSAWARRDGGYVDFVNDETLQPIEKNANRVDTYVLRAALTWAPTSKLSITPGIDYQVRDQNQQDEYWLSLSNPSTGSYLNATPDRMPDNDHFVLPTLKVEWDAGPAKVISNTSYFDRRERVSGYSGTLYNLSYFQHYLTTDPALSTYGYPSDPQGAPCANNCQSLYPLLTATGPNIAQDPALADYVASNTITNAQQNFTQEIRVVSADAASPVQWTAGFFYSFDRQQSNEQIFDPQLPQLTEYLWGEDMLTAWGENLLPGGVDYDNDTRAEDQQEALFADASWAITRHFKLEVGLRYAWTHFRFINSNDGPQDLLDDGGVPAVATGSENERPFTPKATFTWQPTADDLVYATVSKGYRIGGATPPLPVEACGPGFPDSYGSDHVWNYEVGTKDQFLERSLAIEASAFYITWSNIQQAFYVPTCGIQFTTNAGSAVSKGVDFQGQWRLTHDLEIDTSFGYTDAKFTSTYSNPAFGALPIVVAGDALDPDTGPWTATLGVQYSFQAFDRPAFVRVDDTFDSRRTTPIPNEDPRTAFYDPALKPNPPVNQLSAKAGVTVNRWDLALYANNIADAHPLLNYQHEDSATLLYEAETLRPRTIGMAASYRF
jgi:outer membrane receptor protein involved in Fe transport